MIPPTFYLIFSIPSESSKPVWIFHTWLFHFECLHTFSDRYICSAVCTCSPLCLPLLNCDLIWDSCCRGLSLVFKQTQLGRAQQGPGAGVWLRGPLRASHPWGEVERGPLCNMMSPWSSSSWLRYEGLVLTSCPYEFRIKRMVQSISSKCKAGVRQSFWLLMAFQPLTRKGLITAPF